MCRCFAKAPFFQTTSGFWFFVILQNTFDWCVCVSEGSCISNSNVHANAAASTIYYYQRTTNDACNMEIDKMLCANEINIWVIGEGHHCMA